MIYKKPRQINNSEYRFLTDFLKSNFIKSINQNSNYEVSLIQEPYTGFGYADLVCIIWDKIIYKKWSQKRNNLSFIDIKVLHHLYNSKVFKDKTQIKCELGYGISQINNSISNLLEAELIKINKQKKVKIKPLKDIFFLKEIISIEAKLKDWKKALEQCLNNTQFASKSFALFPAKTVKKSLIEKYKKTNVGVISFETEYKIVKNAKKYSIPSNLNSWFFNEYIGREVLGAY